MLIRIALALAAGGARGPDALAGADIQDAPADNEHYQLRAEVGAEYDSNAHRVEQIADTTVPPPAPVESLLQRVVVSAQLADQMAPGHAITWSMTGAAKIFDDPAARSEDVAVAQSSLLWRAALGPRAWLSSSGTYYEAFQNWAPPGDPAGERRDFRSLAPGLELRAAVTDALQLSLGGGYRWLVYKPDRDFDFRGPTLAGSLRWLHDEESGADWEARAVTALELRQFGGPAHLGNCSTDPADTLPCPSNLARNDTFTMTGVDVTRTGRILLGLGYALQYNASNSVGETVIRHVASARVAAALPLALYLAARADVLFAFYRDGVPVVQATDMTTMTGGKPYATIEDENRSSVRLDLSRDVGDRLRALLRYTFYANELSNSSGTYRRHTLLLSLAFTVEK